MKDENEKSRKRGGRSPKGGNSMAIGQPMRTGKEEEPTFPEEWISIAAYYIWKSDGQPEGRDAEYWERARTELTQLQKEGNLPSGPRTLEEDR
jgi:hypothetical protein